MSSKVEILTVSELQQKMIGRNLAHIHRTTGISQGTIYEIARGSRRDTSLGVAIKLSEYFAEH